MLLVTLDNEIVERLKFRPFLFHYLGKNEAKAYMDYFNLLWKMAKSVK